MYLKQVDVVGLKTSQCAFDPAHEMKARAADIVRVRPDAQTDLRRQDRLVAAPLERRAENRFRRALRIDIRRIEEIRAGIEAQVDETPRLFDIGLPPSTEQGTFAAERACTEAKRGHFESGTAQNTILHRSLLLDDRE